MNGYARRRINSTTSGETEPARADLLCAGLLAGQRARAANWQTENQKIQAWNAEITRSLVPENPAIAVIGEHLTENWSQLHTRRPLQPPQRLGSARAISTCCCDN